jgi:hypothetical protein
MIAEKVAGLLLVFFILCEGARSLAGSDSEELDLEDLLPVNTFEHLQKERMQMLNAATEPQIRKYVEKRDHLSSLVTQRLYSMMSGLQRDLRNIFTDDKNQIFTNLAPKMTLFSAEVANHRDAQQLLTQQFASNMHLLLNDLMNRPSFKAKRDFYFADLTN